MDQEKQELSDALVTGRKVDVDQAMKSFDKQLDFYSGIMNQLREKKAHLFESWSRIPGGQAIDLMPCNDGVAVINEEEERGGRRQNRVIAARGKRDVQTNMEDGEQEEEVESCSEVLYGTHNTNEGLCRSKRRHCTQMYSGYYDLWDDDDDDDYDDETEFMAEGRFSPSTSKISLRQSCGRPRTALNDLMIGERFGMFSSFRQPAFW